MATVHRAVVALITCAALGLAVPAASQPYEPSKPRRQFVSVSVDWLYSQPLHFAEYPLRDLVGAEVAATQFQEHDYETRDGLTRIDVLEFGHRTRGLGLTVYPLGTSVGVALGVRGSIEALPTIRVAFDGPGALDTYALTGGRAQDVGLGIFVSDRSSGWGLGSRAFVVAGAGRLRTDIGDGRRLFAEGGGGISSGPFGVEIALKFAWNRLEEPARHRFLTVPVTLRGTLSF